MKKMILVIVVAALFLSGCGLTDNNFPSMWDDDLYHATNKANVALLNSSVVEPERFSMYASEIAYLLEKERDYQVIFLYEGESGNVISLPTINWYQRLMNKKEYREMLEADLTSFVLNELEQNDIEPGKFVGTVMTWQRRPFLGGVPNQYTVCDLDGDGKWDYLVSGMGYFGETSDESCPRHKINEFHEISFITEGKVIELDGLSGDETVSYFEKIA